MKSADRAVWLGALIILSFGAFSGCGKDDGDVGSLSASQRAPGFDAVTAAFGPSIVRPGEYDAEAPVKPWSSWWFPVTDTYLFQGTDGQLSPLEKYDRISADLLGVNSHAAQYEHDKIYDPSAASWEGLCNAWSAASLLAPEPTHGATVDGVQYSVGDLKALLVKSYESVDGLKQYGQRFDGDASSVFEDIYAEQFHRFLEIELFQKHRPFIMDKDPGVPVWNTPVWKATMRINRDPSNAYVMHVDTWLVTASPFVTSYDYVGTLSVALEYTYDLHGFTLPDGGFRVVYGKWTGDSVNSHPDFVVELPTGATSHHSNNPELDTKLIETILKTAAAGSS